MRLMEDATKALSSNSGLPTGVIREGLALIKGGSQDANNVFYNPVQVFNRDLSILAILAHSQFIDRSNLNLALRSNKLAARTGSLDSSGKRRLRIMEPLAATGLRAIRYALELSDNVDVIVAGDIDCVASQTIQENQRLNGIPSKKMKVVCCDANQLMFSSHYGGLAAIEAYVFVDMKRANPTTMIPMPIARSERMKEVKFNVIDLDPYGSVAQYLDAAVQAIDEGGLLCLTSTDMPVLCGNNPEVSFYKYGGTAIKAKYMHEMALRLLLNALATTAAKYKRVIQPLASCSIDFYIRCFVRVVTSPQQCKHLASTTAVVLQCSQCDFFQLISLGSVNFIKDSLKFRPPHVPPEVHSAGKCEQCQATKILIGGPFYSGRLHNKEFIQLCLALLSDKQALETSLKGLTMVSRLRGLLTAIYEELEYPLFYLLPSLINRIKTETMKLVQFKTALLRLGYEVSFFHREPLSIKTNAPSNVIFDILRKWAEMHVPKNPKDNTILQKPYTIDPMSIHFDPTHPDAVSKYLDVAKWPPNPTANWGPKARARAKSVNDCDSAVKKVKV